jgi:signal transduction histidine kinase
VEIKLKDTGAGIPEEIRTKIFDPFFTTKEVGKGTGQGLAISHAVIVDKHGGTINYETEMGKGTTFIIRLPWRSSGSARIFPDEGVPGGEHSSPTINKLQSS